MLPLSTLVLFVLMGLIPSIEPPATHAKETSGFSGLNKQYALYYYFTNLFYHHLSQVDID